MKHEKAVALRLEMLTQLERLRDEMKKVGNPLADLPLHAEIIEKSCGVEHALDNLTDDNVNVRAKWHHDMKKAIRALSAAADRYNEMRAHLAVAIHALRLPESYEQKPPADPTEGKDTTELN